MHLIAPLVRICAYGLNLVLYLYHLKQGVVTSGVLFSFWLLQAICAGVTFRSVLMTNYVLGQDQMTPFTNYVVQYSIILALFFLFCWADSKPTYISLEGKRARFSTRKYFFSIVCTTRQRGQRHTGEVRLVSVQDSICLV